MTTLFSYWLKLFWRPYFPLRTASLFSYGKKCIILRLYFCLNDIVTIKILSLIFFPKTTYCPFNVMYGKVYSRNMYNTWTWIISGGLLNEKSIKISMSSILFPCLLHRCRNLNLHYPWGNSAAERSIDGEERHEQSTDDTKAFLSNLTPTGCYFCLVVFSHISTGLPGCLRAKRRRRKYLWLGGAILCPVSLVSQWEETDALSGEAKLQTVK